MSIIKHPYEVQEMVDAVSKAVFDSSVSVGSGGSSGYITTSKTSSIPPWVTNNPIHGGMSGEQMIFMRLYGGQLNATPNQGFDFLSAYRFAEDRVAIFVCNNGKYVVLEDDHNLFPSDSLITQLRILAK
jgi:hypothetical protein